MKKKYKLGLALSGGGVKGAAHCGAIQAMEEYGVHPDIIAGTSVGSIVGAYYASGVEPIKMCEYFATKDFKDLLTVRAPKTGFFDQTPLVNYLKETFPVKNFDELQIPLRVISCELDSGTKMVFTKGELAPRVMASCSIPVFFYPMKVNGKSYVDGGVLQNFPVRVLRDDCEKVIGINLNHLKDEGAKQNVISVAMRSFYIMFNSNTYEDTAACDINIAVDTKDYSAFDTSNIPDLFKIGYDTAVIELESYGYQRLMPQREVSFPTKEKHHNTLDVFDNLKEQALRLKEETTLKIKKIKPAN